MTETGTVQRVIAFIGLITTLLVAGLIALALLERDIPEGLLTLAGTGLGALGAVLVSTRSVDPAPTPEQAVEFIPDPAMTDAP